MPEPSFRLSAPSGTVMPFHRPIVTVQAVEKMLGVNYQYANRLVRSLEEIGLLRKVTGGRRNRRFGYGAYLDLLTADET